MVADYKDLSYIHPATELVGINHALDNNDLPERTDPRRCILLRSNLTKMGNR